MKEQLIHILDQSVCLTRRQITAYIIGKMEQEEKHAAELHISSCPLCSMAVEGFEAHTEEGLAALSTMNSDFLKEHFDKSLPQIHLNSIAPAVSLNSTDRQRSKTKTIPLFRIASVAAAVLVAVVAFWYFDNAKETAFKASPGSSIARTEEPLKAQAPATQEGLVATKDNGTVARESSAAQSVAAAPSASSPGAAPVAQQDSKYDAVVSGVVSSEDAGTKAIVTESDQTNDVQFTSAQKATAAPQSTFSRSASPDASTYTGRQAYGNSFTPEEERLRRSNEAAAKDKEAKTPAPVSAVEVVTTAKRASGSTATTLSEESKAKKAKEPEQAARQKKMIEDAKTAISKGQDDKARKLLQSIIDEGGPRKREAKKLLRRMDRD